MKILVAVPTFENIQPEVFKAIYNLDPCGHDVHFDYVRGHDCAIARNEIGKLTIADHYDYVLMVDSDTMIPTDTLRLMLDPPVDICLGVCPRKNTKDGKSAMIKLDSDGYYCSSIITSFRRKEQRSKVVGSLVRLSRRACSTILTTRGSST